MRSLAPLSHDPRPEWNHSLNGLSSAMLAKTIVRPNLSLCVKSIPKTSLRRSSLFFVILLSFLQPISVHTHSHTQIRSRGRTSLTVPSWHESCSAAVQQPSRSSVTTCLPRKRRSSLSLNNSLPAPRPTPISCFHGQIH